jgi:hypothetical protein
MPAMEQWKFIVISFSNSKYLNKHLFIVTILVNREDEIN